MQARPKLRLSPLLLSVLAVFATAGLTGCGDEGAGGNEAAQVTPTDNTPGAITDAEVPHDAVKVTMTANPHAFQPQQIQVARNQTVVWTNTSDDLHTVTSDPNQIAGGPNSEQEFPNGIPKGGTYTWVVPMDAPFPHTWYYHCRFHGTANEGDRIGVGMVGSVTVVDPQHRETTPTVNEQPGVQGGTTGTTDATKTTRVTPTRTPSGKPYTPPVPSPDPPQITAPTAMMPNDPSRYRTTPTTPPVATPPTAKPGTIVAPPTAAPPS